MEMFTAGLFRMFVTTKALGVDSIVLQLNNLNNLCHSQGRILTGLQAG